VIHSKGQVFWVSGDSKDSVPDPLASETADVIGCLSTRELLENDSYTGGVSPRVVFFGRRTFREALTAFRELGSNRDSTPVVVICDGCDPEEARELEAAGAWQVVSDKVGQSSLGAVADQALEVDEIRSRLRKFRADLEHRFTRLTPRETEIYELMVVGYASKEVGAKLGLSPRTVESHRGKVMQKMEAPSVPDLVRFHLILRSPADLDDPGLVSELLVQSNKIRAWSHWVKA